METALNRESQLVRAARHGDAGAFRELYDVHVDRVYSLTFRFAGCPDLARDMTQETFVRAWQRLDQFRGDAAFGTWLHTIAVSTSLNVRRRADRHLKRERPMENAGPIAGERVPSHPLLRDRIRSAVDQLPDIYRVVFLMHDLEGFSHGEIARTLNVAEGTSKARLSRARARLRDLLHDLAPEHA